MEHPSDNLLRAVIQEEHQAFAKMNAIERVLLGEKLKHELEELDGHYQVSKDLFWNARRASGTILSMLKAHRETVTLFQRADWQEGDKVAEFENMGKRLTENQHDFDDLLSSYSQLSANLGDFATSITPSLNAKQSELTSLVDLQSVPPPRTSQTILRTPVVLAVGITGSVLSFVAGYKLPGFLWIVFTTIFVVSNTLTSGAKRSSRSQRGREATENKRRAEKLESVPNQLRDVSGRLKGLRDRVKVVGNVYKLIQAERDALAPLLKSNKIEALGDVVAPNQAAYDEMERSLQTYSRLGPGMSWP